MRDSQRWDRIKQIFWILTISIVLGLAVGKYLATVHIPPGPYITTPSFNVEK